MTYSMVIGVICHAVLAAFTEIAINPMATVIVAKDFMLRRVNPIAH